jgi:hypothetical protein
VPTSRYPFAFAAAYRLAAAAFGVTSRTALVLLADGDLVARFGPWQVRTQLDNVAGVRITGPYAVAKTIGPPHLSFADRGLTMATNSRRGVCVEFNEPVPGIEPTGRIRHPALTVTVADCTGLVAALNPLGAALEGETEFIVLRPGPGEDAGIVPALYADKLLARAEMVAPGQDFIRFHEQQMVWAYPSAEVDVVDGHPAQVWLVRTVPPG